MTCHGPIDNPFNSPASIYSALFDYLSSFSIVRCTIKDLGSFRIVIFSFWILCHCFYDTTVWEGLSFSHKGVNDFKGNPSNSSNWCRNLKTPYVCETSAHHRCHMFCSLFVCLLFDFNQWNVTKVSRWCWCELILFQTGFSHFVATTHHLVRFPNPLATGSGLGLQCP